MTPIEQQEIDQIDSHIDFLLESLDNKVSVISKLLGKLYNQKENSFIFNSITLIILPH